MKAKRFSAPVTVRWNGVTYESYAACARALGIRVSTVRNRALRGHECDADVLRARGWRACEWNGKEYPSVAAAARDNWITQPGMLYRVQKGQTSDDQLKGYRGSV